MRILLPTFTLLQPLIAISCFSEPDEASCITCEDLDQNLSGLEAIDWNSFGIPSNEITKLRLRLNDEEPEVNSNYIPVLENALSDLSDSLTDLTLIHFNNAISNRVLKKAPLLDTLHIARTQLDTLPERLFKDTNIENFRIADSEMEHFNNQIFGQSNLRKLKFERNRLSSLDEDSFQHLQGLEHLDLSDNDISQVHVDVLKYLKDLKRLDLDNNGLSDLPVDFLKRNRELRHLSIAGNNIQELPCDFLKMQFSLATFNITGNQFTTIPCHLIHRQGEQLIEFDASNNNIHDRYNTDLSHKRGASFRLNKKGLKANGLVKTEVQDDKSIEFLTGSDRQIAGTLINVCQACERLPPRKILRKKANDRWEPEAQAEGNGRL